MNKTVKRAGCLLLPLSLLFLILFLNWEPLSYAVLKKVARFYAGRADIELEFRTASGRPLSETILGGVFVRPAPGQPQTFQFQARSIRCSYELRDLKDGLEPFLQGLVCSVNDPSFTYDFRITSLEEQAPEEPPSFIVPSILPRLEIHNGSVDLADTGWGIEILGIDSMLRPGEAGHELLAAAGKFRFIQEGIVRVDTGFSSRLQYANEKLSIDFLELAEKEIRATGLIDLQEVGKGTLRMAADLASANSRLSMSGSIENRFLKIHAGSESFDIGELRKRLGGSGWDVSGQIKAEVELAYNLETEAGLAGDFGLEVRNGSMNGVDIRAVDFAGSFHDGVLNIAKAEAESLSNHVTLSKVSIPMGRLYEGRVLPIIGGAQADFSAGINDNDALLKLFDLGEEEIPTALRPDSWSFRGRLASGVLSFDEARVVAGESTLAVDHGEIPVPATLKDFSLLPITLEARFTTPRLAELLKRFGDIPIDGQVTGDMSIRGSMKEPLVDIKLAGEYLRYNKVQLGAIKIRGDARFLQEKPGSMQSAEIRVLELEQTNDDGTLSLQPPLNMSWQPAVFSASGTFQADGQGEIAIKVARSTAKEITAEISASSLDSDGWLANFIDHRYFFHNADFEVVSTGLPQSPKIQIAGTVDEVGAADVSFPLAGRFGIQYSSSGIEISEFIWKSHGRNQLALTGKLPYDPLAPDPFLESDLALKGHVDFPALEDFVVFLEPWGIERGSLALDLDLAGPWQHPSGHILLKAEGVEPPEIVKQQLDSPMDLTCNIVAQGDAIFLKTASIESTAYTVKATGSWQHALSVKTLLQKPEMALEGEVALDATMKLKDLNFLRKTLPWLRRLEGDLQGELHVSGPVAAPAIKGSFSLQDGEVSHIYNFPMLSSVDLRGDFDDHSIMINKMQAELGGSPVNLRGKISKELAGFTVDLHADGKNVLLFRNNDMRMRGDVQLDVSGPLESLNIKGSTGLTSGYYSRNIDFLSKIGSSAAPVSEGGSFLFSFTEPPLKNAVFDIRITTIEPFRIRNNLIRGVLRPELTLKGTGELPFLLGTVYIDPSRVLLPSGRLLIQSGLVRFLEGEPDRPQLDILAQSKLMGYDINVVIRGPVSDPVITLSSSPALPNDELLMLLLTGQPPRQDAAGGDRTSGTRNVMVYLGRDFLNKWLEDDTSVNDENILDRFELDLGRSVTKSGEQTVESTFRLSQQTIRTGKIYYLSAEKDKYDAYNYGLKLVFRLE